MKKVSLHFEIFINGVCIGLIQSNYMIQEAILINCSRGPVVDEEALVEHLKHNPMFRVGLDVFEDEPYMKPGLADMASFCIKGTYVFIIFFIHGHHSFIHMIFF